MSFRKEKKYRLTYSELLIIKKNLIQSGMNSLYPARIINSCYFDTHDLKLFSESEEGVLPRKKVRIRWYNKQNNFTKEVKISSIEGRFKYQKKINIQKFEDLSNLRIFDKLYGELTPILNVSYEREYFSYKSLRLTFDKNITYTFLKSISKPVFNDNECVMEIKVPINCNENYIEKLIHLPTTRFSKYTRGCFLNYRKN
tara:strand:- start:96 stop:692 length:597 start_codon:yes stop_codon:yes gene_type:complete